MCPARSGAHAVTMFFLPSYEATKVLVDDHVADLRRAASGGRPLHRPHHRFGWWGEARHR
jgi:hypothetical protein